MKTKFTLLITACLFFTAVTQAQGYNDHGYANNNNMRQDRHDIYRDNARISHEKNEVYRDVAHGNYRDARYDRFELNRDRRDRFSDRRDLRVDRRDIRYDRRSARGCF